MKSEETERYSISIEEFQDFPEDKIDHTYQIGDRVERSNITAFWNSRFRFSRGIRTGEYAYVRWVELQTGFNNSQSGKNYLTAGGWDVLHQGEQSKLFTDYRKIARIEPAHDINTISEFGKVFDHQLGLLLWSRYYDDSLTNLEITESELENFSAQQLLRVIAEYAHKDKQQRKLRSRGQK